jgi:tetratricopeptide (TPR) repeat protein
MKTIEIGFRMKRTLLLAILGLSFSSYGLTPEQCQQQSQKAEELSAKNQKDDAFDLADDVVQKCKPAPYNAIILAGKITLHHEDNPKGSIPYFAQAIKQGPDFYMGYLNMSAAYMGMEEFDQAINYAKLAVEKADNEKDRTKGRYNLALGYYKKAAPDNNKEFYEKGYSLLIDTVKDPLFKRDSHFLMGMYEEIILHDEDKARPSYKKACDLGHSQSCLTIKSLAQRMAPYKNMKGFKPAGNVDTLDSEGLVAEIKKCYKAKYNMTDSAVETTVASFSSSVTAMAEDQKKQFFAQIYKSMSCQ